MERETGIEPATSSLGSWRSTAELLPLSRKTKLSLPPAASRLNFSGKLPYQSPHTPDNTWWPSSDSLFELHSKPEVFVGSLANVLFQSLPRQRSDADH